MDRLLDRVIVLFKHLREKDVFERYYKSHLAKRLLHNKTSSEVRRGPGGWAGLPGSSWLWGPVAQGVPARVREGWWGRAAADRVDIDGPGLAECTCLFKAAVRTKPWCPTRIPQEAEKGMILRLRQECGYTFTSKLEAMFQGRKGDTSAEPAHAAVC